MIITANEHIKLDVKDKKILYELDVNARQSNAQIGKKVGVSKDLVNYRIKQLEKEGIIKGYYAVFDISKLGYINFRVFLRFSNVTPQKETEIIDYLINNPKVGWLVRVEGTWDLNMLVWAKNVYEFETFWKELMNRYRNYLEKNWVSIITQMIQFDKIYLCEHKIENFRFFVSGGSDTKSNYDDIDWKILSLLANNARMPLLDIAKKIDTSSKVVVYRIKKMMASGIILSCKALLDLNKLGIQYYKVHISLHNLSDDREKALFAYAKANRNIIIIDVTIGGADFEIEIHAQDNEEFHAIVDDLKTKFSDIIRDYETFHYYREYKWIYLPLE